jgi:hypothetical protein
MRNTNNNKRKEQITNSNVSGCLRKAQMKYFKLERIRPDVYAQRDIERVRWVRFKAQLKILWISMQTSCFQIWNLDTTYPDTGGGIFAL